MNDQRLKGDAKTKQVLWSKSVRNGNILARLACVQSTLNQEISFENLPHYLVKKKLIFRGLNLMN